MSLTRALVKGSISTNCAGRPAILLWVTGCLCLVFLLTSCNSKKYLKEGQSFLRDNKLSIKSKHPIPNKSDLYDNLATRYLQKQTKTVAGIPRHVFYYKYQESLLRKPDRKKWDEERLINNRPVIHDSVKAEQTTVLFERYLASRGYRYSQVSFRANTQDKETTVYYQVDPGPRIYMDTFEIIAEDTVLQVILDSFPDDAFLTRGSPLDIQLYNQEKIRIVRILQNRGYTTFTENNVSQLEVDTAQQRVKATMRILNPTDSTTHNQYTVQDIIIYPDFDITQTKEFFDTTINLITYELPDSVHFTLEPEAIERNLFLVPGKLSRRDDFERTFRNLSRIDLVKFVTWEAIIDTSIQDLHLIDYRFNLTRKKKIDFQGNVELTYSNIAAEQRRSLIGTAANVDYRDLNIFGGAEVLGINLETGFEFNFLNTDVPEGQAKPGLINSVNIGTGVNLSFPRFMDPLRMYHMIGYRKDESKKALIGNKLKTWLIQDALTRLSLGYNFVTIQDLYQYYTINANLSYVMQPDLTRKLTIDHLGFDLFVPDPKPDFDTILMENKFQRESFGKQLYTGLLFRNYLLELNTKAKNNPGYFKIFQSFELSGLEVLGINSLVNIIAGRGREFILTAGKGAERDTVRFSHFARGELDLRYLRDIGRGAELRFKFNTGLAIPYGPYSKQVPYLKQFFVGGALSNRAWQIRELGPGGYQDTSPINPNLPFYQTGDFKLDLSLELEFKLFWYIRSAIFIDASNVWTLNDDDRTLANFEFNRFYREFGVGYGFGFRLDFDFFILRFDLGYKLFSPYPVLNSDGVSSRFLKDAVSKFPAGAEPQIAVGQKF